MKYAELTRKLARMGCYRQRQGSGSHELWRNPATRKQAAIPYHATKDIGPKLFAKILRDLGIERDEFNKA